MESVLVNSEVDQESQFDVSTFFNAGQSLGHGEAKQYCVQQHRTVNSTAVHSVCKIKEADIVLHRYKLSNMQGSNKHEYDQVATKTKTV